VAVASLEDIDVTTGPVTCSGTSTSGPVDGVELREGMTCSLPVTVLNDGRLEVHVGDMILPAMGTAGGAAVHVPTWDDRSPEGHQVDAVFTVDRRLEPGETWETTIDVEFRPDGCTALGTFWAELPQLEVSAWSRSAVVSGSGFPVEGTSESEC